jgi:hypothetical protein
MATFSAGQTLVKTGFENTHKVKTAIVFAMATLWIAHSQS